MKTVKGDLLTSMESAMFHVANLYHTFGGGIAYHIAKVYPEAYEADKQTTKGDIGKIGTYSFANIQDSTYIFNLYAQYGIGNDGHPLNRNCSYDHLYNAAYRAATKVKELGINRIGVPYLMGCGLAGGEWIVVEAILKSIEEKIGVEFIAYNIN